MHHALITILLNILLTIGSEISHALSILSTLPTGRLQERWWSDFYLCHIFIVTMPSELLCHPADQISRVISPRSCHSQHAELAQTNIRGMNPLVWASSPTRATPLILGTCPPSHPVIGPFLLFCLRGYQTALLCISIPPSPSL